MRYTLRRRWGDCGTEWLPATWGEGGKGREGGEGGQGRGTVGRKGMGDDEGTVGGRRWRGRLGAGSAVGRSGCLQHEGEEGGRERREDRGGVRSKGGRRGPGRSGGE